MTQLVNPRIIMLIGIFFSGFLLWGGCKEPKQTSVSFRQGDPVQHAEEQQSVRMDLVEYFSVAEVNQPVYKIDFADRSLQHLFSSGWANFEGVGTPNGRSWTDARNAVVDVPIWDKQPLKVHLTLSPPSFAPLPEQGVQLLWNDALIHSATLAEKLSTVEFVVPAENLYYGINRLELRPRYWVQPAKVSEFKDNRSLGVLCREIRFEQAGFQPLTLPTAAQVEQNSLIQFPGSLITYHFPLPRNGVFQGEGILQLNSEKASSLNKGKLMISLLDSDHQERILFSQDMATLVESPQISFRENLSDLAGKMAALSLSFWVEGSREVLEGVRLEWKSLRLEGVESRLVADQLDRIRGEYNILVILFDALRADHIEPYGNIEVKTPNMSRLASQGTTFLNAFTQTSWTRPSVASILTSLYPSVHQTTQDNIPLSPEVVYLPEILQKQEYRTILVHNNPHLDQVWGFTRGFDEVKPIYEIPGYHFSAQNRADLVWEQVIDPLIHRDIEQPFFIYLHELDPHGPYDPPPPYDRMYTGDYDGGMDGAEEIMHLMRSYFMPVDQADVAYMNALYKGEITYMDGFLGRILDRLEQSGLSKNTLVIFTSDHGEEFWEHQRMQHQHTLYDELLHVPLILSLPGVVQEGKRPAAYAQLIDLPPTILDLVGIRIPSVMQGKSLLPYLFAPDDYQPDRQVFAELSAAGQDILSVRFRQWKLIAPLRFDGVRLWRLYDLEKDPGEQVNRWSRQPVIGRTLRQMLAWQMIQNAHVGVAVPDTIDENQLDPAIVEKLKSLGYLK